jgi:hypothetical protein
VCLICAPRGDNIQRILTRVLRGPSLTIRFWRCCPRSQSRHQLVIRLLENYR